MSSLGLVGLMGPRYKNRQNRGDKTRFKGFVPPFFPYRGLVGLGTNSLFVVENRVCPKPVSPKGVWD